MTTWLPAFFVLVKMLNYLPRKYTKLTKMYLCSKKTIYGRPFTGNLYRIEKRW